MEYMAQGADVAKRRMLKLILGLENVITSPTCIGVYWASACGSESGMRSSDVTGFDKDPYCNMVHSNILKSPINLGLTLKVVHNDFLNYKLKSYLAPTSIRYQPRPSFHPLYTLNAHYKQGPGKDWIKRRRAAAVE